MCDRGDEDEGGLGTVVVLFGRVLMCLVVVFVVVGVAVWSSIVELFVLVNATAASLYRISILSDKLK